MLPERNLEAEHGRFRQTSSMIANFLFPLGSTDLINALDELVLWLVGSISSLLIPTHSVSWWRDYQIEVSFYQSVVTCLDIVGTIHVHFVNFGFYLVK